MPLVLSLPLPWRTSEEYSARNIEVLTLRKFEEITDLLLQRPNLNSSHLFRADILFDSAKILEVVQDESRGITNRHPRDGAESASKALCRPPLPGFKELRTVVRRLIPRKPQLDNPLEQTCHIYHNDLEQKSPTQLVVYLPHADIAEEVPWYHPPLRGIAYLYSVLDSSLSVHFLAFEAAEQLPQRTHRTLLSLLSTFIRLAKHPSPPPLQDVEQSLTNLSVAPSAIKDTILRQNVVQDTYTDLKQRYATDLMSRWVESTEPSKHVFEDLSIAAFLICLFRKHYPYQFPGFVDIACGNGLLVYILLKEGFNGYGFDARRRKTWAILDIDDHLSEAICIPRPFLDGYQEELDFQIHDGTFPPGTFIISNHADELTPWTPILAALSCPEAPLPFLAIPCCSHALSGARHRYSLKDLDSVTHPSEVSPLEEEQPTSGDLKGLRRARQQAASHQDNKSMYACLTKKVVGLAWELGIDTELTLMRIPSTRNVGIVGGRKSAKQEADGNAEGVQDVGTDMQERTKLLVERECAMSGGVASAARTWIEGARKLQVGQGRGKVKPKRKTGEDKSGVDERDVEKGSEVTAS